MCDTKMSTTWTSVPLSDFFSFYCTFAEHKYDLVGNAVVTIQDPVSLLSFGGLQDATLTNTMSAIVLDTNNFETLTCVDTPHPRNFHSAVCYNKSVVYFGGKGNGYHKDTFSFDLSSKKFEKWTCQNENLLTGIYGHSAVIYNDTMFVYGGYDSNGTINNKLWFLHIPTRTWSIHQLTLDSSFQNQNADSCAVMFHTATLYKHFMLIVGGKKSNNSASNEFFCVNLKTFSVRKLPYSQNTALIEGRYGHCASIVSTRSKYTADKNYLFLLGGCNSQQVELQQAFVIDLYQLDKFTENDKAEFEQFSFEQFPVRDVSSFFALVGNIQWVFTRCANNNNRNLTFYGGMRKPAEMNVNSKEISVQDKDLSRKLINSLSDDILLLLLSWVDFSTICNMQLVSKSFKLSQLSTHNLLWKSFFENKCKKLKSFTPKEFILQVHEEASKPSSISNSSNHSTAYKQGIVKLKEMIEKYTYQYEDEFYNELAKVQVPVAVGGNKYIGRKRILKFFNENVTKIKHKKPTSLKLFVNGDGAVGKTCLCFRLSKLGFPYEFAPTVADNYDYQSTIAGHTVNASIWDTAGGEEYRLSIRPLGYPGTSVFLLCFSVTGFYGIENLCSEVMPQVLHYVPNVPWILVACQEDARLDYSRVQQCIERKKSPITKKQGKEFAKKSGCVAYIECSALTGKNIDKVLELAEAVAYMHEANISVASAVNVDDKKKCSVQ